MTSSEKADLLARVDVRTEKLEVWTENHMKHHQSLFIAFITAAVSVVLAEATTIVGLIIAISQHKPQ